MWGYKCDRGGDGAGNVIVGELVEEISYFDSLSTVTFIPSSYLWRFLLLLFLTDHICLFSFFNFLNWVS